MILAGIIFILLSLLATGEADTCRTHNLDIFRLLTRIPHREQLERLNGGPNLSGIDYSEPVYQFDNQGGVKIESAPALGQLTSAICGSKQATLYARVVFRNGEDGGAVVEASTMGTTVFGLHVYAMFHEIVFVYKHQGVLRTETFQFRMVNGRIYKIAISVDGNLLVLHIDCKEIERRLILIPDYCFMHDELAVTAAEGKYAQEHRNSSTGFSGTLQLVGIYGGQDGLSVQCPGNSGVNCPTCGLHLDRIEEVFRLRERSNTLEEELEKCEEDLRTKDCSGNNCIIDGYSFRDGELVVNLAGEICLCQNGNPNCQDMEDIPTIPPSNTIAPPPDEDPPNNDLPSCPEVLGIIVAEGEVGSVKVDDICTVVECERVAGSLRPRFHPNHVCSDYRNGNFSCNSSSNSRITAEALLCCDVCSPCDSFVCSMPNSECRVMGSEAGCVCVDGYESRNGACVDRDECSLGNQDAGHNCVGNATCVNHPGNFSCICPRGQSLYSRVTGFQDCNDTDECADGTAVCPADATCVNTILGPRDELGYKCVCPDGYDLIENECQPNCSDGCVNGECVAPDNCTCLAGFEGSPCTDINECENNMHNCDYMTPFPVRMECKNTMGGYFCACPSGLQLLVKDGENICEDIDECTTGLHLCPPSTSCTNTYGSYTCGCGNCKGACDSPGKRFDHEENAIHMCTNCTCTNGDLVCKPVDCDCDQHYGSMCCSECNLNDMCPISDADPPINLKIGEMYIDPNDRCTINACIDEDPGKARRAGIDKIIRRCEELSCPGNLSYVPTGACCPVCELPECNADYNAMSVTTSNCAVCTCMDSVWNCLPPEQCDPLDDCPAEHIFRSYDQCCPLCKQVPITDSCT